MLKVVAEEWHHSAMAVLTESLFVQGDPQQISAKRGKKLKKLHDFILSMLQFNIYVILTFTSRGDFLASAKILCNKEANTKLL